MPQEEQVDAAQKEGVAHSGQQRPSAGRKQRGARIADEAQEEEDEERQIDGQSLRNALRQDGKGATAAADATC